MKQLKRISRQGLLFVVVLLVLDQGAGLLFEKAYFRQKTGKYARLNYAIEHTEAEVLIMGDSHATRHYVPAIFQSETGMSCYNAGVQGQSILFVEALRSMIFERHQPKIIILDMTSGFLAPRPEMYGRLSELNPYYKKHRSAVEAAQRNSVIKRLRFLIRSYPYNSMLVHIVRYALSSQPDEDGYRPLHSRMQVPNEGQEYGKSTGSLPIATPTSDEQFVVALTSFLEESVTQNVKVICLVSPSVRGRNVSNDLHFREYIRICKDYDIRLAQYPSDPDFLGHYELFHDASHLNHEGAMLYSRKIAKELSNGMIEYEIMD